MPYGKLISPLWLLLLLATGIARATEFPLPPDGDSVVGEVFTVTATHGETLLDIGRRYGLGYEEITQANPGVDAWVPGEGTEVTVPRRFVLPAAQRRGIVVNLAELRLYYYPPAAADGSRVVRTYPISIGRMDWNTPLGQSRVVSKVRHPAWYPPQSIREEHAAKGRPLPRVVPAGPENPLGAFALRLSIPGYLIHGTNKPAGVGMRVTHGCMRMFPEDIETLFKTVPVDTPVTIVNQPLKVGWDSHGVWLEAHPPLKEDKDEYEATGLTRLTEAVVRGTSGYQVNVDWDQAESIFARHSGIPGLIGELQAGSVGGTAEAEPVADLNR